MKKLMLAILGGVALFTLVNCGGGGGGSSSGTTAVTPYGTCTIGSVYVQGSGYLAPGGNCPANNGYGGYATAWNGSSCVQGILITNQAQCSQYGATGYGTGYGTTGYPYGTTGYPYGQTGYPYGYGQTGYPYGYGQTGYPYGYGGYGSYPYYNQGGTYFYYRF